MSTGLSRIIGAVAAAAVLVFAADSRAEPCDNPLFGLRACDQPDSECPVLATVGPYRANYASYPEARDYLNALDMPNSDPLDYLEVIPLGNSVALNLSLSEEALYPYIAGQVLAARVTAGAGAASDVEKPAILLVCSVHGLEWIPAEVCLGYVDYLVKAANGFTSLPPGEAEAVRAMLEDVEFWVVTHANPGGRLWDENLAGEGDPDADSLNGQYKNYQWRTDMVCSEDWTDAARAGKCGPNTSWPKGGWSKPGINVGNAFSESWGKGSPTKFDRGAIIGRPGETNLIPELFDCQDEDGNPDDSKCAAAFPNPGGHEHCVKYVDFDNPAVPRYGCFMFPPFEDSQTGLDDCINSKYELPPPYFTTDSDGIEHWGCLRTRISSSEFRYLLWECGNFKDKLGIEPNGTTPGTTPDEYDPGPLNRPLLRYCHRGILYSCGEDRHDDCYDSTRPPAVTNGDYFILGQNWVPPHFMETADMPDHLFCSNNNYCSVLGNRSCCNKEYGGTRPFEAIEARIIRDLVNNVPFSFVMDVHAAANLVLYNCTDQGDGCKAGNPTASPPVLPSEAYVNADRFSETLAGIYNAAAESAWLSSFGGVPELPYLVPFPDFMRVTKEAPEQRSQGRLYAWTSNKPVVETYSSVPPDPNTKLYETAQNFDLQTMRGIPSLRWELSIPATDSPRYPTDAVGRLLGSRVDRCVADSSAGAGGRPRSRFLIDNQLDGFKAVMSYMADRAASPFVPRTPEGTPEPGLARRDVGLLGLRVHDSRGRGVQQTERVFSLIASDPTATIVIPAGLWGISFDAVADKYPLDNPDTGYLGAEVLLEVLDIPLNPPLFSENLFQQVPIQSRVRETRWFDFGTGVSMNDDFLVQAHLQNVHPDDALSNNELIFRVHAVDCTNEAERPNGLSADAFCQAGLPFADDRFECHEATGRCRECWAGQACEQFMSFCVNGMCDSPADCWSGRIEDDFEGKPSASYGLGTHTAPRTMYRKNAPFDEDTLTIVSGDPLDVVPNHAVFELKVRVRNLCSYLALGDGPMDEVEVRVQQRSASLLGWDDLLDPIWQVPLRLSGVTATLDAAAVVGFRNGRDLRISVTNPSGEHFAYDLIATIDYAGMTVAPLDPQLPDIPIDTQDEVDVDIELGQFDSFVPTPDPAFLAGHVLFFAPDPDSSPREATFELYSARGALLRTGTPLDGGLGVSVDGLPEGEGPFSARLYSDDGRIGGSVYLCPTSTVDCMTYDPRRNTCGDACDGASDLCCIDRMTGAVTCADVSSDPENCGGCGVACEWDEVCLEGVCAQGLGRSCWETVCPEGLTCVSQYWLTRKNPKCRALLVDNDNCGWLGHVCASNKQCVLGLCLPKMGMACDGDCGQDACCWVLGSQTCVDTTSNLLHCGACGHACVFGEVCEEGACVPWYEVLDPCPLSLQNCGVQGEIACKSTTNDHENCGWCRNRCPDDAVCEDGVCVRHVSDDGGDETEEGD